MITADRILWGKPPKATRWHSFYAVNRRSVCGKWDLADQTFRSAHNPPPNQACVVCTSILMDDARRDARRDALQQQDRPVKSKPAAAKSATVKLTSQPEIRLWYPDSIKLPEADRRTFCQFLQRMVSRYYAGFAQYGPARKKDYLERMKKEVAAYQQTGNQEHLLNATNYCLLETQSPEDAGKVKFDNTVGSVTRKRKDR